MTEAYAGGHVARRRRATSGADVLSYLVLATLLGLRLASGPTANIAYLGLGVYALFSRGCAVRALVLSWLFTMISPGIAPEASFANIGRYVVLLGAAGSAFLHAHLVAGTPKIGRFTFVTALIGVMIVGHSLLFSKVVDVSVLKAASWSVAVTTLLSLWMRMTGYERAKVTKQLFWGLVGLIVISVPLLASATGYLRNGWGFQGILNHPQAFGPVAAMVGTWTSTRVLAERRPSWLVVGLVGLCIALVLASGTRTAGVAMVGAVGLSIVLVPWLAGLPIRVLFPGLRSPRVWFVVFAAIAAALALAPVIAEHATQFLRKGGSGESFLASYDESRGFLIDRMVENIYAQPLTGIGFGVASEYWDMFVERSGFLGLPSGAPVEKGVAFLAIVEELGFVVSTVVLLWLWGLIKGSARGGLSPFAVCLSILLLNLGEATFFSPGGTGMLWLVMITWAFSQQMTRRSHG